MMDRTATPIAMTAMIPIPVRPCAVVLALLPLAGGCTPTGAVTGAGVAVDLVSLTSTRKTVVDHVVSGLTGKDCSSVSFSETGDYCPEKVVVDRSNIYCYRTLADVECHHIPDPYRNGDRALASPPPVIKPANQRTPFD
ncbi:hypothetical protein M2352_003041 [Azospirillum fermentarium]|uniref:hypothetical protein n=1 Tax=Azospirillum fermentarium TaxID=1233114 RepID=UPI002226DA74|nr:hypothetical protein [Azospirillum fermentarium]MCW2247407.1 hypothetical protein [Azospirillum fermentarium]